MPFRSRAQMRACFARNDPAWDCREWLSETPNPGRLPEKVSRKQKSRSQAEEQAEEEEASAVRSSTLHYAQERLARLYRQKAAAALVSCFLDRYVTRLPLEKQAQVRLLQASLVSGQPLSAAVSRAYPYLSREQTAWLTVKIARAAADDYNQFVRQITEQRAAGRPHSPEVLAILYGDRRPPSPSPGGKNNKDDKDKKKKPS